jgi:hypothetical protein
MHWMIQAELDIVNAMREALMGLEFLSNRVAFERFDPPSIKQMDCANIITMETKQTDSGADYRLSFLVSAHILFKGNQQKAISADGFCQSPFYDQIFAKRSAIMNALTSVRMSCQQINVTPLGSQIETSADKPYALVRFSVSTLILSDYQT